MDGNSGGVDEGTKIAMEHGVKVRSPTPPSPSRRSFAGARSASQPRQAAPYSFPGCFLPNTHRCFFCAQTAPFFVVRTYDGGGAVTEAASEDVYTAYLKMKKEVFNSKVGKDEATTDVAMSIF